MPKPNFMEITRHSAFVIILLFILGCKTPTTVSESVKVSDSVRWETRYRDSIVIKQMTRDSVRIKDSVIVSIDSTGAKTTDRWHSYIKYTTRNDNQEIHKEMTDSLSQTARRDSVRVVTIEKKESGWRKAELGLLRVLSPVLALALVGGYVYRKMKR